jgi:hypothetical protein
MTVPSLPELWRAHQLGLIKTSPDLNMGKYSAGAQRIRDEEVGHRTLFATSARGGIYTYVSEVHREAHWERTTVPS